MCVRSLSLWHGANVHMARATSHHLMWVRLLSWWCVANLYMARAILSAIWACQIALVAWRCELSHGSRKTFSAFCVCVCRTALVVVLSRSLCDELVPSDMKTIFLFYGCFALVLVWKFVWDAHSKFLSEDLLRNYPRCAGMSFWHEVLM